MTKQEKRREYEANRFAVCLLMPRKLVEEWIKNNGRIGIYDSNKLKIFADYFGVPEEIARIRINEIQ